MAIKAKILKMSEIPGKTELYEVRDSRSITVEEKQNDGSLDQAILEYCVEGGSVGYFAKEYRPASVQKAGSKVVDITAVMLDYAKKYVRWHIYDMKDTLAGENTIVKFHDQWSSGLRYLQQNVLAQISEYTEVPNIGVITRFYDEERMKRLKSGYQRQCEEIENYGQNMTLAQRKKRTDIAKFRGTVKAAQAILDRKFQAEDGSNTYKIHIRQMSSENGQVYRIGFPV